MILPMLFPWIQTRTETKIEYKDSPEMVNQKRIENELKEESIKLEKKKIEKQKLEDFLNSFSDDIEQDQLEIDIYDSSFMENSFSEFTNFANAFFMNTGRWSQEKYEAAGQVLAKKIRDSEANESETNQYKAFLKAYHNGPNFGPIIGRSNDRYDYFMYLKHGLTYQPKYISKEKLIKILKNNKYGYLEHCIF